MSTPVYTELTVDGIRGPIRDNAAIHGSEFSAALSDALIETSIKSILINMIFPIGAYHITADNTNPSQYFGGTWEAVEGRVLLGASESYPVNSRGGSADAVPISHRHTAVGVVDSNGTHSHDLALSVGSAGVHSHSITSALAKKTAMSDGSWTKEEIGSISGDTHKIAKILQSQSFSYSSAVNSSCADAGAHTHSVSGTVKSAGSHTHGIDINISSTGASGTGKNMMPYVAAYIWKRTA